MTPTSGRSGGRDTMIYGHPNDPAFGPNARRTADDGTLPYGHRDDPAFGPNARRTVDDGTLPYGHPDDLAFGPNARRPALTSPDQVPMVTRPAPTSPDQVPMVRRPAPTSPDQVPMVNRPAPTSPDQIPRIAAPDAPTGTRHADGEPAARTSADSGQLVQGSDSIVSREGNLIVKRPRAETPEGIASWNRMIDRVNTLRSAHPSLAAAIPELRRRPDGSFEQDFVQGRRLLPADPRAPIDPRSAEAMALMRQAQAAVGAENVPTIDGNFVNFIETADGQLRWIDPVKQ